MREHVDHVVAMAQKVCALYRASPKNGELREVFDEVEVLIAETEVMFGQEIDGATFALSLSEGMSIKGEGVPRNAFKAGAEMGCTLLFKEYSQFMTRVHGYHEARMAWLRLHNKDVEVLIVARQALRTTTAFSGMALLHAGKADRKSGQI